MVTTITVVPVHQIELMKPLITITLAIIPMPILLKGDYPITKAMTVITMDIIKGAFTVTSITIMVTLIMDFIIQETARKDQLVAILVVASCLVENNYV